MTEYPRLLFGDGHDERSKDEMTDRGYVSNVYVETERGRYPVYFSDPTRLRQDLESEAQWGRPYFAEPGLIVVPEVTVEAMTKAIEALHGDGYFDHLQPVPSGV